MIEYLDLTEHEGFIHNLIRKWKIPEQDREDVYQDFFIHFHLYAKYDPEKGKPTTLIPYVFKNFMGTRKVKDGKHRAFNEATRIEERDKEYLDREQGGYELSVEDEIYINELLSNADQLTLDLISGATTCSEQAKVEGVSRQAVSQRHLYTLRKLTGE